MKLTQFAFAAILVLLLVAGYLTLKSDLDSRLESQNAVNDKMLARMEELAKKQAQPQPVASPPPAVPVTPAPVAAPVPQPPVNPVAAEALAAAAAIPPNAPLAADNDPRMLEDERKVLNLGAADRVAEDSLTLPATAEGQTLTKIQQRIVALPAIARVKQYADKEGMIVLDRGSNVGLKPGDQFSLRRKTAVIGKIRISDTINPGECIADVLPGSMPVGMLPAVEDEVIQFE
ncbi:MAG: hypothetical protein V4675_19625 [Verrucomicrobiota bacterium]